MATNQAPQQPSAHAGTDQDSYNKMGMFTFVASMVASLGVLIYVSFLSGGIDLKEVPEAKTAQTVPGTNAPTNPAAPAATGSESTTTQGSPNAPAAGASAPAAPAAAAPEAPAK